MSVGIIIFIVLLIIIGVLVYLYIETDVLNFIKGESKVPNSMPQCVGEWTKYKNGDKPTISCMNSYLDYVNYHTQVKLTLFFVQEAFEELWDWIKVRATVIDKIPVDNLEGYDPFRLNVKVKNDVIIEAIEYG